MSDLPFNKIVKNLRLKQRRKHREVAEAIGVATSTYSNVESSEVRRIGRAKAELMADFYKLPPAQRERFMAAYDAQKDSDWNTQRKERIETGRRRRLTEHGKIRAALRDLIALVVASVDDAGQLCICTSSDAFSSEVSGDAACELCNALRMLGLPGWTTKDEVVMGLGGLEFPVADAAAETEAP